MQRESLILPCGHKFTEIDEKVKKASKQEKKDFTCSECNFRIPLRFFKSSKNFQDYWENMYVAPSNLVQLFHTKDSICCSKIDYIHYNTMGEYDEGWGCAYRCVQMILSALAYRGYSQDVLLDFEEKNKKDDTKEILTHLPSIFEIQIALAERGNIEKKDIGTHLWIEPPNCAFYLKNCCKKEFKSEEWVFYNPNYKFTEQEAKKETVYICKSFEELSKKLLDHFKTQKLPVMYDDSIQAFTLEGIRERDQTEVLRFDPHECDDLTFEYYEKNIVKGDKETSGVSWMNITKAFKSKRYMMTFPILEE